MVLSTSYKVSDSRTLASVAREGLLLMSGLFWDLGEADSAPWRA
jgi:hypothetical protein